MSLKKIQYDWSPKTNYRKGRGRTGLKEKNYKENKYVSSTRNRARRRTAERATKWDRQTNQFTEDKQDNTFEEMDLWYEEYDYYEGKRRGDRREIL